MAASDEALICGIANANGSGMGGTMTKHKSTFSEDTPERVNDHLGDAPLQGLKIVEFAGLGPAPMVGMMMADMGADVVRIEREAAPAFAEAERGETFLDRNRRVVTLDLKLESDVNAALGLVSMADIVIEGYRPGVMERLGLGPEVCSAVNSRLVYGRITGWGQTGPLAQSAGHDINYIAITGALAAIGTSERPVVPLNLLGDFAGGTLYLVVGILAALLERQRSGRGQVIDAAMLDGVTSLLTSHYGRYANGKASAERGENLTDGSVPFYSVYKTADEKWVSIGALEPKFFAELVAALDLDITYLSSQYDKSCWPTMRDDIEARFGTKTRDEWTALLQHREVCFAPVLSIAEAHLHPQNQARGNLMSVDGTHQPAPAPHFSRSLFGTSRSSERSSVGAVLASWSR